MSENRTLKKRNVLIIGDWFIDENWIVTTESSITSSHTGMEQYRSRLEGVDAQLLSLCGAGLVAQLIHGYQCGKGEEKNKHNLYGIGLWEPDDTKYLSSLFRFDHSIRYQTPLRLQGMSFMKLKNETEIKSLCGEDKTCLESSDGKPKCEISNRCKRLHSISEDNTGTWRVLRVYSQTASRPPVLLHRVDWEYKNQSNHKEITQKKLQEKLDKLESEIDGHFDAVVIVDHCKGGVTLDIIGSLMTCRKMIKDETVFYARCKNPKAPWINLVKNQLKLMVTGPMNLELEQDPWFYGYHLSIGAIKWLCDIADRKLIKNYSAQRILTKLTSIKTQNNSRYAVVAFHENQQAVAYIPYDLKNPEDQNSGNTSLLISNTIPNSPEYRVGRINLLFAYLVTVMEGIGSEESNTNCITREDFQKALGLVHSWCKKNQNDLIVKSYRGRNEFNFRKYFTTAFETDEKLAQNFQINVSLLDKQIEEWNNAYNYKGLGLNDTSSIEEENFPDPRKKFQVWRGWSSVPGYISILREKRSNVEQLKQSIREFTSLRNPNRSLSAWIVGGPGAGKSFLVKTIAKQMQIEYREFNITRLATIQDLMSCFDTISSIQTQKPDTPLMVFWDEINAELNGQNVYSYFLGPIWDGVYRRGGETFQLKPCIWIFAGTRDISLKRFKDKASSKHDTTNGKNDAERNDKSDKGSDLKSRINGPVIHFSENSEKSEMEKMEQLYMVVSLIKRQCPGLLKISEGVLTFFRDVKPMFEFRSFEFIVSRLRNISHGQVGIDQLPSISEIEQWIQSSNIPRLKKIITDEKKKIETTGVEEFVRIYEEPPVSINEQYP